MRRREVIALLGAAAACPLGGYAQNAMPVIGVMSSRSPEDSAHLLEAFRRGPKKGGFTDGEKVAVEFCWARGDYSRLPTLAADLASRPGNVKSALLVAADPYFDTRRERIIGFAAQQRLPAIYQFREYAVAGGLLSYGLSITDAYRQCGVYTAKILKGANPADLPVLTSTKFELVINLKTAKTLGIKISDNLLSLADEVIE